MSILARLLSVRGVFLGLDQSELDPDPVRQFQRWFGFARRAGCPWPTSFCLSTTGEDGRPSARMMLLKGVDARGFVFYTHYVGRKAREMERVPFASMTFHWIELVRQVRIEGRVLKIGKEESEAYFGTRPRGSQIGAWVSRQSEPLGGRKEFEARFREMRRQLAGKTVPLPEHWGGYRVDPDAVEFWQGRPNRLHDRFRFEREGAEWRITRLNP